jgi:hypothetical protein
VSGIFLSQLIVAPVLAIEAWIYLATVRRRDPGARTRTVDWAVIATAAAACLALLPLVVAWESGGNDRIWHPVASVLSSFFVFPLVLLAGLGLRTRT